MNNVEISPLTRMKFINIRYKLNSGISTNKCSIPYHFFTIYPFAFPRNCSPTKEEEEGDEKDEKIFEKKMPKIRASNSRAVPGKMCVLFIRKMDKDK